MLKIAVCDDEGYFVKRIQSLIIQYMGEYQYDCEIDTFESGQAVIEAGINKTDYDIIFLDVNMQEMDGIETARAIKKLKPNVYIIFVTAYITYALEGYKVDAIRYLLKEDENLEGAMKECLDTVLEKMNYKEIKCVFKFQSGEVNLNVDKLLYVESRLHKLVFFVLSEGVREYYMYDRLDHIEQMLDPYSFQRVHQSFLVNMKYVKRVERYKLQLVNGLELSISKKYYKDVETQYLKARSEL